MRILLILLTLLFLNNNLFADIELIAKVSPKNDAFTGMVDAEQVVAGALPDGMTATTQSSGDNSTKLATTAYVDGYVTGFSQGSVLFADSSGYVAEDNSNFFWDDTNNRFTVGSNTNTITVATASSGAAIATSTSGGLGADFSASFRHYGDTAISGAGFYGARARGSEGSESIVQDDDALFEVYALGYDGVDYAIAGSIGWYVDGTPGSNDMPGRFVIATTADGAQTATDALTIDSNQYATFASNVAIRTTPGSTYALDVLGSSYFDLTNGYASIINKTGSSADLNLDGNTQSNFVMYVGGSIIGSFAATSSAFSYTSNYNLGFIADDITFSANGDMLYIAGGDATYGAGAANEWKVLIGLTEALTINSSSVTANINLSTKGNFVVGYENGVSNGVFITADDYGGPPTLPAVQGVSSTAFGAEDLLLQPAGSNVGIAKTPQASYRLDVLGQAYFEQTNGWASITNSANGAVFTVNGDTQSDFYLYRAGSLVGGFSGGATTFQCSTVVNLGFLAGGSTIFNSIQNTSFLVGSSNFFKVTVGSTEQIYVDSTGVGIGTTSPTEELTIAAVLGMSLNNANTYIGFNQYYSGGWKYHNNGYGGLMKFGSNGDWEFYTAGNNASGSGAASSPTIKFFVKNDGNVGIGTTSPATKLQVGSTADTSANAIRIAQSNSANSNPLMSFYIAGANETFIGLEQANGKLLFGDNPASYATADLLSAANMTIEPAGNVGIGTSSPAVKLHIRSTNYTDDFLRLTGNETQYYYQLSNYLVDANNYRLDFKYSDNDTSGTVMSFLNGNVGIGTTSPVVKLQINQLNGTYNIPYNSINNSISYICGTQGTSSSNHSSLLTLVDTSDSSGTGGTGGGITFAGTYKDFGTDYYGAAGRIRAETLTNQYSGHIIFETVNNGVMTEQGRVSHGGNWGFGTNGPTHVVHIAGNGPIVRLEELGTYNWYFGIVNGETSYKLSTNSDLSSPAITVNSSGSTDFVRNSSTTPCEITFANSAYDGTLYQRIGVGNSSYAYNFYFAQNATQSGANWVGITNGFSGTARNFQINGGNGFLFQTATGVTAGGTISWTNQVVINASGMAVGTPTGGNKGVGTINCAADIYKNNSAYTNPDYALEHYFTGRIIKYALNEGAAEYKGLMPLNRLKSYLQENYRLPGITDEPAGTFKRNDIVLEKLEEAHLYITQLYDENQKIKSEIKQLEQMYYGIQNTVKEIVK